MAAMFNLVIERTAAMKTWIKRTLIGALGVTLLAGGLTACSGHGRHGGEWSAERITEMRGKVVGKITDKLALDSTQKQKLELLADQLLAARTAMRGTQTDPRTELQALIGGAQFDRSRAQALLDQKTQAVQGSGPNGRISQDDVKTFTKQVMASLGGGGQRAVATVSGASIALPDFSKWGAVERKGMSGIRRKTSEHLSHAWNTIPHVTQFDKADITALEQVRKQYRTEVEKAGGNLTVTAILTKIVASALKTFPQFNASVDAAGEAIVYKKYVHVGIAVDTENGLLVPVVRNADQKNLTQIAVDIQQLADKAKARKLSLDDMSGGSMSISNLGGIGGTAFTPIVNWPEVAILGVSRGAMEPKWNGTSFEPRLMLPLSLSYDHRLIDGADAIRFLRWVVDALENPFALALRG